MFCLARREKRLADYLAERGLEIELAERKIKLYEYSVFKFLFGDTSNIYFSSQAVGSSSGIRRDVVKYAVLRMLNNKNVAVLELVDF